MLETKLALPDLKTQVKGRLTGKINLYFIHNQCSVEVILSQFTLSLFIQACLHFDQKSVNIGTQKVGRND